MLLKVNAFNITGVSGWDNLQLTTAGQITANLNDYESGAGVSTNLRLEVVTPYTAPSSSGTVTNSAHHGWEEGVWDNWHYVGASTTAEWFIEGPELTIGSSYLVRIAGVSADGARDANFSVNSASGLYDNTSQAEPITPTAPVELTATAQDNGTGVARLTFTATGVSNFQYLTAFTVADVAPTIQTTRKGSTLTVDKPGTLGTVTTATLNAVNVFDHLTAQDATTATFAGAVTDEITTSGEYALVLGDGTVTEIITVQVNVIGVAPSNNPVQKDGAALASLTGVQVRVTNGANINGTELYYSGTATTNATGNLSNIDLSSTAAADTDPVLLHLRTAAGDSIIASETVGLI